MSNMIKNNDTRYEFLEKVSSCSKYVRSTSCIFTVGDIKKLNINREFAYIWQDAKGNVNYSFNLLDKEYFATSTSKLGNALTSHFERTIEAVNNYNESLKKVTNSLSGLNKALSDSQRHNDYLSYSHQFESKNQIVGEIDMFENRNQQTQQSLIPQRNQQPMYKQEQLHSDIVELSVYQLEYNKQIYYICISELPIVHKELFKPYLKQVFFREGNLIYKNRYIPSKYMVNDLSYPKLSQSFIVLLILFMAKNDLEDAMKIFVWIANSFNSLRKEPFTLVLHSKDDVYMKLLYEEILIPFFNIDHCEKIGNDNLDEKSLSSQLNQKVIYNFHNVTTPITLDTPTKDFTNRLIHKDDFKLNNKVITTVANILITSTTQYIPLIAKDVPKLTVDVESNLDEFCKEQNIYASYHIVSNLIENDLDNFAAILRSLDIDRLNDYYNFNYYNEDSNNVDILDCDVDVLEVFKKSIKNKDIVLFEILKIKKPKLYQKLIGDFYKNRVDRKNLISYFTALFGTGIYKSNRALIAGLKDLSDAKEPFDNLATFNNNGRVYYTLY